MRRRLDAAGYQEVRTPQLVDRKLWIESGHWEKFREHMFIATVEDESEKDRVLALKPMNCPCHVQIFNQGIRSYRELPLRMAEFGSCHRYEPSGALHGIMRVRAFTQDDAHIFCTEGQIADETARFVALLSSVYRDLGFPDFRVKFADRPPTRAGDRRRVGPGGSRAARSLRDRRRRVRAEPGGGRLLRPEAGIRAARRHRPRLAVRHPPGGLRPPRAPRRRSTPPRTAAAAAR